MKGRPGFFDVDERMRSFRKPYDPAVPGTAGLRQGDGLPGRRQSSEYW